MTLNELRLEIAEILDEAKKKKEKAEDLEKKGRSVEAYGLYDETFDFSAPLGGYNLYRQQGVVNWGPYTSGGPQIDSTFANPNVGPISEAERALRSVVRDVIRNGIIPEQSAWAPLLERESPSDGVWGEATRMFEAWYDRKSTQKNNEKNTKKGKAQGFEKDQKRGGVRKHGVEKKGK